MELEIVERTDALTRIALTGRMDSPGVDQVGPQLEAALAQGGDGVLDLSGVSFLSSLGVRLLITTAKRLDRRGSRLVLVAPGPLVGQALRHASIDEIIPVAADVEGARSLLGS